MLLGVGLTIGLFAYLIYDNMQSEAKNRENERSDIFRCWESASDPNKLADDISRIADQCHDKELTFKAKYRQNVTGTRY
jgi:hypothetical protein